MVKSDLFEIGMLRYILVGWMINSIDQKLLLPVNNFQIFQIASVLTKISHF